MFGDVWYVLFVCVFVCLLACSLGCLFVCLFVWVCYCCLGLLLLLGVLVFRGCLVLWCFVVVFWLLWRSVAFWQVLVFVVLESTPILWIVRAIKARVMILLSPFEIPGTS